MTAPRPPRFIIGAFLAVSLTVSTLVSNVVTQEALTFLKRDPLDHAANDIASRLHAGTWVLAVTLGLMSAGWAWLASTLARHGRNRNRLGSLREPTAPENAGPLADMDALTGLPNQRGFTEALERTETPVVIALLDLNALKHVNAQGGHGVGDAYIKEVANDLRALLPDKSVIARWGGAAFIIALPGFSESEVVRLLDRAIDRMRRPIPELTAFTYGLAEHTAGAPLDRALALADAQLHERRAEGKPGRPATGEYSVDALEEFNSQLHTLTSPHEVIERGLPLARRILGFDVVTYLEVNAQESGVRVTRALGMEGHVPPSLREHLGRSAAMSALPWLRLALNTPASLWSNDYPSETDHDQLWAQVGVKSALCVPVVHRNRLAGLLVFLSLERWRGVTPPVRQLAETVAHRLGDLLDQYRLNDLVHKAAAQSLSTLGLALEARHVETQGHTERVTKLALTLGKRLNLDAKTLESLRQGALLHDVGKLAIPDAILSKPGHLDPEERAIIETHSMRGFELASKLPGITDDALSVVRYHHERWDGSGYPDRLSSLNIPLLARIFAVCDVFDALTHARSYKDAWPQQSALEELQRQAGKQFDPQIVAVFVRTMELEQMANKS